MTATEIPNLRPPPREDTSLIVARKLLSYVLTSELKQGDRLPSERELAAAAGVSRPTVREALKALGFLGLLEVRQGEGTFVANTQSALLPKVVEWGIMLGDHSARDVVEARAHVEPVVAGLAAGRRSEDDLEALRRHLQAMHAAVGDRQAFSDHDVEFHLAMAQAAGNSVFADMINSMQALLIFWSRRTLEGSADLMPYYHEHAAVLDAVEAGDAEGATSAMERHMEAAVQRIQAALESSGVSGAKPPHSTSGTSSSHAATRS